MLRQYHEHEQRKKKERKESEEKERATRSLMSLMTFTHRHCGQGDCSTHHEIEEEEGDAIKENNEVLGSMHPSNDNKEHMAANVIQGFFQGAMEVLKVKKELVST